ncbi:MAG: hypothetical protein ABFS45_16890 [Pseudomonadota bacterium]
MAIAGHKPADALQRGEALLANGIDPYWPAIEIGQQRYSIGFLQAVDYALMFKATDRPQSALKWKQMLLGESVEPTFSLQINGQAERRSVHQTMETMPFSATRQERDKLTFTNGKRSPRRTGLFVFLGVVLILIIAGIYFKPVILDSFEGVQVNLSQAIGQDTRRQRIIEQEKRIAEALMQAEQSFATEDWSISLKRYREVLKLDPENRPTQQGIERIARHYMDLASNAMQQGRLRQTEDYLSIVEAVRPDTINLQALKNKLTEQNNLLEARQKDQERQARLRTEKMLLEATKQKASIEAAQAQLSKAQDKADVIEARIRAADMYGHALYWRSQAYELISTANKLHEESRHDDAIEVMKRAQAALKQSIDDFKTAQMKAELQRKEEVFARRQVIQVERSQESIRAAQDRLADTKAQADAISALIYAPEPYQLVARRLE